MPWQRLPTISCECCPAQATHRIVATDSWIIAYGGGDYTTTPVVERADVDAALTCADCLAARQRLMTKSHGSTRSRQLRMAWQQWAKVVLGRLDPPEGRQ